MLIKSFTCVICGCEFERDRSKAGQPPQVCGEACHKKRADRRVREWQKNNRERTLQLRRETNARYYAKNREAQIARSVQYGRDHPEWKAARDAARRALRLGSPNAERFSLDEIYERDGRRCHLCSKSVKRSEATMDHLIPLSLGGPHTRANVALAHRSCNSSKGNRVANEQLRLVG